MTLGSNSGEAPAGHSSGSRATAARSEGGGGGGLRIPAAFAVTGQKVAPP